METKEIITIIFVVIILAFSVSVVKARLNIEKFSAALLFFAIILIISTIAKKATANYLQADVETKVWQFQRYSLRESGYFKTPIPAGIILPLFFTIASLGSFYWLAATQSEIKARVSRAAKKHDFYSYSEMTEFHIGAIPAAGIFACLILAFIAYLLGNVGGIDFTVLGKLSIIFAGFNMIPLGNLDGTKIFFGSIILWFILAALCLIALGYTFFLY